ncbi:class I SAM-dependent methyltransferase [Thermoanaerobacterium sp. CMT5567-10]|uniref:class I SAM-dependent methyltransferase n=1 Tax=Thermoanaerobacterium sp. CMT5567-10 TaxID=3061989 RepID=UPI0026E0837F|nr:class I SAM-dependent methyltransferase [Thermoanaerobacterium sp. CMT5567-10]WKV10394.1 class I SAM-dependent methyltransferase [Thermoanaerobacterium sp. CMT5567-10]
MDIESDLKRALDLLGEGYDFALDVGTGRARMAYALARYGYNVVSLEYNIDTLKKAKEMISNEDVGDKILFVHGDAHEMPFIDESFEVVTSYNAMHHMDDYKAAIDEMMRVLKRDGKILITELNDLGKEKVAESHRQRGSHHEAKIDIYDVVNYIKDKYNINGEISKGEFIDIFYGKNWINFDY